MSFPHEKTHHSFCHVVQQERWTVGPLSSTWPIFISFIISSQIDSARLLSIAGTHSSHVCQISLCNINSSINGVSKKACEVVGGKKQLKAQLNPETAFTVSSHPHSCCPCSTLRSGGGAQLLLSQNCANNFFHLWSPQHCSMSFSSRSSFLMAQGANLRQTHAPTLVKLKTSTSH